MLKKNKKDTNFRILNKLFAIYYYCFDEKKYILKIVPIEDIVCKCLVVYSKESDSMYLLTADGIICNVESSDFYISFLQLFAF